MNEHRRRAFGISFVLIRYRGGYMRARGFFPTEIIFAATGRCNLSCAHCYVTRNNAMLDIEDACRFLMNCTGSGIERVGFSGGEPFLYPEFLETVCKTAVDKGLLFGRITTNGCWWNSTGQLESTLRRIYDSGFDGKIGLSYDSFHGQPPDKAAMFCEAVFNTWNNGAMMEIQSVVEPNSIKADEANIARLAEKLGCETHKSTKSRTGTGTITLCGNGIFLPVHRTPRSFPGDSSEAWQAKRWFKEDFCAGPGNILYVHSDGNIAPCCGYANERQELRIGNIRQPLEEIMRNAEEKRMVRICYIDGLSQHRKILQKGGTKFRGKTDDNCAFCDFLCNMATESPTPRRS